MNGAGVPANRASIPAAAQSEVDSVSDLTPKEIAALIPRVLQTKDLDLRPFLTLSPLQVAELTLEKEWALLCKAMLGMAALGRGETLTKTQRWSLAYFCRASTEPKALKKQKQRDFEQADVIEVEAEA